ncbi:hypothetical protein HPB52_021546 [Rhipicephalus sanguineus]|uniref:Uncharacterized protein n=1 Tax=Rhipicephalus sanguineus TaxID=34632 RepID=A0A9D4PEU3_RHISA|nr:hypothetical protein HPB52_021546 [Rhipicephalus sanguineus]
MPSGPEKVAPLCLAGCIPCSVLTCSWPGTGPRPALDKFTIPSSRHPRHVDTIRVPIRPQAGPPGPFRNPKRRGAALTLTRRACTSVMQRLAEPSVPPTTNDAPPVSPASCCATAAAVPTLSLSGDVSRPTPTTVDQPAAFPNSAHAPATCNASVLETPSSSTLPPDPKSLNTASASQSVAHDAVPIGSAPGILKENSMCADKSFCPPLLRPTTFRQKWTSRHLEHREANRKPASTARPRTELITVGIQLPPGTLTPKLPLYDLLASIIAAANLSPKISAAVTLQAKPAQSLVFLKTHSPLTAHLLLSLTNMELNGKPITIKPYAPNPAISRLGVIHNACGHFTSPQLLHGLESFTTDILAARMKGSTESGTVLTNALSTALRPSAAAVQRFCPQILLLTFVPIPGVSIAKSILIHLSTPPALSSLLSSGTLHRTTQPCPPSSSTHEFRSPPATSTPGSYAAKVKGASPVYPPSSNNTPSPSMINESRSFDLRLAMLESNQREQQRVSDELQQKIHALTQTLETTTSSLTSELAELNKQLATLTAPTSDFHVAKLADMVETTTTAHHTRLVQLETSITRFRRQKRRNAVAQTPPPLQWLRWRVERTSRFCSGTAATFAIIGPLSTNISSPALSYPILFFSRRLGRPAPSRATVPTMLRRARHLRPHWHPAAVALAFDTPFLTLILTFSVYGVVINVCNALFAPSRITSYSPPALMICVLKSWLTAHPSSTLVGTRCVTASTPHCSRDPHGLSLDLC